MILLLLLICSTGAFDKNALKKEALSFKGITTLFIQLMRSLRGEHLPDSDYKGRLRIFRKNIKEIVEINDSQDKYEVGANFMAVSSDEEQKKWYMENITSALDDDSDNLSLEYDDEDLSNVLYTAPEKFWRKEGKVTNVKSQHSCGSCWSFAAIGSFEGHYAITTGALKSFSEQELVDCTYNGYKDGCKSGQIRTAFDKLKIAQHLAIAKYYPYKAICGECQTEATRNGMTAAKLQRTVRLKKTRHDGSLVKALNIGPVAIGVEIKGGFNYYKRGIFSVRNCGRSTNHAMTVTGYTAKYFELKNSWGSDWGDAGYIRFDREIENMCGISDWMAYPELKRTGYDTDKDTVTPDYGDETDTCKDTKDWCKEWARLGKCQDGYYKYMAKNCPKSCNICGCNDFSTKGCIKLKKHDCCKTEKYSDFMEVMCKKTSGYCESNKCPSGLKFCDGECKHEHFCKTD